MQGGEGKGDEASCEREGARIVRPTATGRVAGDVACITSAHL